MEKYEHQEGPSKEELAALTHLKNLTHNDDFIAWRNFVVKDNIALLEQELRKPLEYSETDLKAKLLHLNSLRHIFYDVFEIAQEELK